MQTCTPVHNGFIGALRNFENTAILEGETASENGLEARRSANIAHGLLVGVYCELLAGLNVEGERSARRYRVISGSSQRA